MSKLTKVFAMLTLAFWGVAVMHCALEGLPGFDFLKSCCFAESSDPVPEHCDSDGCSAVEDGQYRSEEETGLVVPPQLALVLCPQLDRAATGEPRVVSLIASESPPELAKAWQFAHRTAVLPRAPSIAS